MTRRAREGALRGAGRLALALGLVALTLAACQPAASPVKPSVLLVSIDTLRADRLGCYGYGRPTTPALDRLAAQGTLFEQAVAPSPWTLPSHASLLTGLLPAHHGMLDSDHVLPPAIPTLAETLSGAGWRTAAFVNTPYLAAETGLVRGFQHYRYFETEDEAGRQTLTAEPAIAEIRAWLDAQGEAPFFLFFHTFDVHSDYRPEPRYRKMLVRPYAGGFDGRSITLNRVRTGEIRATKADVAHVSDLYDAGIRQLDDRLALLFEHLDATGLAENTYVVVVSDHGEEFFEHGSLLHGRTLFEELIRVPLLVRGPGIPEGVRVPDLAQLVDLPATLTRLLGVAPLDGDGRDLRALWLRAAGGTGAAPTGEPVVAFAELAPWWMWRGAQSHFASARTDRFKLIRDMDRGVTHLYDLDADPREKRNIAASEPERVGELSRRIDAYVATRREDAPRVELSPEKVEQLRALGYLP